MKINKNQNTSELANNLDYARLKAAYKSGYLIFKKMKFPVSQIYKIYFNDNMTTVGGSCAKLKAKKYIIYISTKNFKVMNNKGRVSLMIHEMLHTLPKCFDHQKIFKKYAEIINQKFNLDVHTFCSFENVDEVKAFSLFNFILKCEKCGSIYTFDKKNKILEQVYLGKNIHTCGGKLKIIKGIKTMKKIMDKKKGN
jgi:hypothetical protein